MTHIPCQPIYMQIFFVKVQTQIQLKNWSKYNSSSVHSSPKLMRPFGTGVDWLQLRPSVLPAL